MLARRLAWTLALTSLGVLGTWSCASVWGFKEPTDLSDAATDASAPADGPGAEGAAPDDAQREGGGPADGGCSGACITEVPAGWQGPLEIYEGVGGPPPPAPPACQGSYPATVYDGYATPVAAPASCSCTCGEVQGARCPDPVANYFSDNGCSQACGTANQPLGPACTALAFGTCGGTHVVVTAPPASGGHCEADAGVSVPDAGWRGVARLCAASAAPPATGCAAGSICAAPAGLPFAPSTYCVARSGTWACPQGYPAKRTYYTASVDARGCSPCSCGSPHGGDCAPGTLELTGDTACQNNPTSESLPLSCMALGGAKGGLVKGRVPEGGACSPSGGTPTGELTPSTETTICCTE